MAAAPTSKARGAGAGRAVINAPGAARAPRTHGRRQQRRPLFDVSHPQAAPGLRPAPCAPGTPRAALPPLPLPRPLAGARPCALPARRPKRGGQARGRAPTPADLGMRASLPAPRVALPVVRIWSGSGALRPASAPPSTPHPTPAKLVAWGVRLSTPSPCACVPGPLLQLLRLSKAPARPHRLPPAPPPRSCCLRDTPAWRCLGASRPYSGHGWEGSQALLSPGPGPSRVSGCGAFHQGCLPMTLNCVSLMCSVSTGALLGAWGLQGGCRAGDRCGRAPWGQPAGTATECSPDRGSGGERLGREAWESVQGRWRDGEGVGPREEQRGGQTPAEPVLLPKAGSPPPPL